MSRHAIELATLRLLQSLTAGLGDEVRLAAGDAADALGFRALDLIIAADGLSQRTLARRLGRSPVYVTRLVDGLERRGLAVRGAFANDRRRKRLVATDQGRALHARVADRVSSLAAELFRDTPEDGLAALHALTRALARRLDACKLSRPPTT